MTPANQSTAIASGHPSGRWLGVIMGFARSSGSTWGACSKKLIMETNGSAGSAGRGAPRPGARDSIGFDNFHNDDIYHVSLCLLLMCSWSLFSSANFLPQSTSTNWYFLWGRRTSPPAGCSGWCLWSSLTPVPIPFIFYWAPSTLLCRRTYPNLPGISLSPPAGSALCSRICCLLWLRGPSGPQWPHQSPHPGTPSRWRWSCRWGWSDIGIWTRRPWGGWWWFLNYSRRSP